MKKLILALAIIFCAIYSVNSQESHFGVKAGVNFASIGGDDTEDADGRTSFHVGVLAELMFTDQFGIQPEVLYSSQGAKAEDSESGFTAKGELKLDYINVPILAKYIFSPGFSAHLGPQIGFLTNAEFEYEESFGGETISGTEDVKEFMNDIDFGLAGGLGYKLDMGLFFNARYVLGISDINDDDDSDYSQQNNVFQFSVGYMF